MTSIIRTCCEFRFFLILLACRSSGIYIIFFRQESSKRWRVGNLRRIRRGWRRTAPTSARKIDQTSEEEEAKGRRRRARSNQRRTDRGRRAYSSDGSDDCKNGRQGLVERPSHIRDRWVYCISWQKSATSSVERGECIRSYTLQWHSSRFVEHIRAIFVSTRVIRKIRPPSVCSSFWSLSALDGFFEVCEWNIAECRISSYSSFAMAQFLPSSWSSHFCFYLSHSEDRAAAFMSVLHLAVCRLQTLCLRFAAPSRELFTELALRGRTEPVLTIILTIISERKRLSPYIYLHFRECCCVSESWALVAFSVNTFSIANLSRTLCSSLLAVASFQRSIWTNRFLHCSCFDQLIETAVICILFGLCGV